MKSTVRKEPMKRPYKAKRLSSITIRQHHFFIDLYIYIKKNYFSYQRGWYQDCVQAGECLQYYKYIKSITKNNIITQKFTTDQTIQGALKRSFRACRGLKFFFRSSFDCLCRPPYIMLAYKCPQRQSVTCRERHSLDFPSQPLKMLRKTSRTM